jgi:hypothetical protein
LDQRAERITELPADIEAAGAGSDGVMDVAVEVEAVEHSDPRVRCGVVGEDAAGGSSRRCSAAA